MEDKETKAMKIMVLADTESRSLWDFFEKSKLEGIELILSCGDLNPHYLQFLSCFTKAPILYVHGNHDTRYINDPPEGCICIEDKIYKYKGIRILGLGGSMKYKDGPFQYSQRQMNARIRKLRLPLMLNRGFDILVAHSPAFEINDGSDLPHQGFCGFNYLMDKYHPKYFCHGHVHMSYGREHKRLDRYKDTEIINGYEKYIFTYGEKQSPQN